MSPKAVFFCLNKWKKVKLMYCTSQKVAIVFFFLHSISYSILDQEKISRTWKSN